MAIRDLEKEYLAESVKNARKIILIENLDELGLTKKKKSEFIKFYYENLDTMNLLTALEEFNKNGKK